MDHWDYGRIHIDGIDKVHVLLYLSPSVPPFPLQLLVCLAILLFTSAQLSGTCQCKTPERADFVLLNDVAQAFLRKIQVRCTHILYFLDFLPLCQLIFAD